MWRKHSDLQQVRVTSAALLMQAPEQVCPVVGVPAEIGRLTVSDVRKFYDQYYAPQNAVLTITGNCESGRALKLAEIYFGSLSPRETFALLQEHTSLPDKQSPMQLVMVDRMNGRRPGIYVCFSLGTPFATKWYSTFILGRWLAEGNNSVLYRLLIDGKSGARSVRFSVQPRKEGTIGTIFIEATKGQQADQLKQRITEAFGNIANTPIDKPTLRRLKEISRTEFYADWITTYGKADALSQAMALYGRVYQFDDSLKYLNGISELDVQSQALAMSQAIPTLVTIGSLNAGK